MPPRRVTPTQIKSIIRQAESKYNQAVRRYNAAVKRGVDDYNREARAHNSRVRANHRRLQTEITRLNSQRSSTRYTATQTSTIAVHTAYRAVEEAADAELWADRELALVDLAEAEAANSAHATNTLLDPTFDEAGGEDTQLTDELSSVSPDLDARWRGALFALDARNPDAARHFCTSAREIVLTMIDSKAPDAEVLRAKPDCQKHDGKPTRREKVGFLLKRYGTSRASLGDFLDADVHDVLSLFGAFNSATHGAAGRYDIGALRALKKRVEGSVQFLSVVIRGL